MNPSREQAVAAAKRWNQNSPIGTGHPADVMADYINQPPPPDGWAREFVNGIHAAGWSDGRHLADLSVIKEKINRFAAELARLRPGAVGAEVREIAEQYPGLNLDYYGDEEVRRLKEWSVQIHDAILAAGSAWRPIAEAPKDGTHILIGWYGAEMRCISRWLKTAGEWLLPVTTAPVPMKQPTCWHPLPSIPPANGG